MSDEKRCGTCDEVEINKLPPCPNQCMQPQCKAYPTKVKIDYFGKLFIWVYGAPSVGKSTLIRQLCPKYNLVRLHTGELLHAEVQSGSIRAQCIKNIMSRGELVPNDAVMALLHREIDRQIPNCNGVILDGYPRDKRQGMLFEKNIAPVNAMIFLDGDKQTITARHLERAGNTDKRWPTDKRMDNCVAGSLQLRIFFENHKEIFQQYPHKIHRINTKNKTAEQIFEEANRIVAATVAKNDEAVAKALQERARKTDCFAPRRIYDKKDT